MKKYLKTNRIKHLILRDNSYAVLVERWIRTLKEKIHKYLTYNKTKKFIDVFDIIINNYNNTKHTRTKFKPVDVNKLNENIVFRNLYRIKTPLKKSNINIGDKVRLALIRGPFDKGYLPNYSNEIFTVYKIYYTSPFLKFRVKDKSNNIVRGSFYDKELIKISF